MAIELPNARTTFVPDVPREVTGVMLMYLRDLNRAIFDSYVKMFDNVYTILATGTSGTFLASGGATITVDNGVITKLV